LVPAVSLRAYTNCHVLSSCRRPSDLLVLHSFPTRRSSDLGEWLRQPPDQVLQGNGEGEHLSAPAELGTHRRQEQAETVPSSAGRSEEHTSELQSRENLVCRLLLEKTKSTRTSSPISRSYSL